MLRLSINALSLQKYIYEEIKNTRTFSRLFHDHKMYLLPLAGLFIDRNYRFAYRFTILQLVKPLPTPRVLKVFLVARPGVRTLTKLPKDSGYENGLFARVSAINPARELEFTSLNAENVKRFVLISSSCFTYLESTVKFHVHVQVKN